MQQAGQEAQYEEIFTESVRVESKLFFLDARSNNRGPYLKVSERKTTSDSRATVVFPSQAVAWLLYCLDACISYPADSPGFSTEREYGPKVFRFELGSNRSGGFFKVIETGPGPRGWAVLFIPAGGPDKGGWSAFNAALQRANHAMSRHIFLNECMMPMGAPTQQLAQLGLGSSSLMPGMLPGPSQPRLPSSLAQAPVSVPGAASSLADVAAGGYGSLSSALSDRQLQQLLPPSPHQPSPHHTRPQPHLAPPEQHPPSPGPLQVQVGPHAFTFSIGSSLQGGTLTITEQVHNHVSVIQLPTAALRTLQLATELALYQGPQ